MANTADYGIEFKVRLDDSLAGYNKLIDFQGLSSDIGLYAQGGLIRYYTLGTTAGAIDLGTDFTIGLARSANSVEVFLNGASILTAADASGQAMPLSNTLNFFEDDFATGQGESFAGSVDFIRIHEDASTFGTTPVVGAAEVPEPTTLALLAVGLIGAGVAGKRRR